MPPHLLRLAVAALGMAALALPARTSAQAPATDGRKVFAATCAACHQATGEGVAAKYPPLAGSEWVVGDEGRLVRLILLGLTGEVEVQGEIYSGVMPGWGPTLKDTEIAAVATYVRSSFGNAAPAVSAATVAQIRAAVAARTTPWTAKELLQVMPVRK